MCRDKGLDMQVWFGKQFHWSTFPALTVRQAALGRVPSPRLLGRHRGLGCPARVSVAVNEQRSIGRIDGRSRHSLDGISYWALPFSEIN